MTSHPDTSPPEPLTAATKYGKPVMVEWHDSCSPARIWHDHSISGDYTATKCFSVGWILRHDESTLLLGRDITDDQVGAVMAIPSSCVVRITIAVEAKAKEPAHRHEFYTEQFDARCKTCGVRRTPFS